MKLLEREAAHQRAKYLKYKKVNKMFAKNNNPKEDTVTLYELWIATPYQEVRLTIPLTKIKKTSIAYNSYSDDDDKISSNSIYSKRNI